MRKFITFGLALLSVVAFSAVAVVGSASAEGWLSLAGQKPTKIEHTLTDGELLLHHKPPAILGGGEITIKCTGSFHGTIGPGPSGLAKEDSVEEVLGLAGEKNALKCTVSASTNSICPAGEAVTVTAVHLPWGTELLLINSNIFDHIFEDPVTKPGAPGYETTCKSIKTRCEGLDRSKWDNNVAGEGALFLFLGEITNNCPTDGGTGTVTGHGVLLGWNVT